MMFRLNFGNGQVWECMTLAAARREIAYHPTAWIERYEHGSADCPGDWLPIPKKRR